MIPTSNRSIEPIFPPEATEPSHQDPWHVLSYLLGRQETAVVFMYGSCWRIPYRWSTIVPHAIRNEVGIGGLLSEYSALFSPQEEEALKNAIASLTQMKRTNEMTVHEDEKENIDKAYVDTTQALLNMFHVHGDEFQAETLRQSFMSYGVNEVHEMYDAVVRIMWECIDCDRYDLFTDQKTWQLFIARCNVFFRYYIQHHVYPHFDMTQFSALPIHIIFSRFLSPIPYFEIISQNESVDQDDAGDHKTDLRISQCLLIAFGVSVLRKFHNKKMTRFTIGCVVNDPEKKQGPSDVLCIKIIRKYINMFGQMFANQTFDDNVNANKMVIVTASDDLQNVNIEYVDILIMNGVFNNWSDTASVYNFFKNKQADGFVMQRFGTTTNINAVPTIKSSWHHRDTYALITLADICCSEKWALGLTSSLSATKRLDAADWGNMKAAFPELKYNEDNRFINDLKKFVFHDSYLLNMLNPSEIARDTEDAIGDKAIQINISDKAIDDLSRMLLVKFQMEFHHPAEVRTYIKYRKCKVIDDTTVVVNIYQNHKNEVHLGRFVKEDDDEKNSEEEWRFEGIYEPDGDIPWEKNDDLVDESLTDSKLKLLNNEYAEELDQLEKVYTDISDEDMIPSPRSDVSSSYVHPTEEKLEQILQERGVFTQENWRLAIKLAQEPERRLNGDSDGDYDEHREVDPRDHYQSLPMDALAVDVEGNEEEDVEYSFTLQEATRSPPPWDSEGDVIE